MSSVVQKQSQPFMTPLRWGLFIAMLVFTLTSMFKLGQQLTSLLSVQGAEAMIVSTPTVVATTPVATVDAPVVEPTAAATAMPTTLPTPVPPTSTPLPPMPYAVASENGVNLREGPSTYHEKIAYLEPGTRLEVIGRYSDWWQVKLDATVAWVYSGVVDTYHTEQTPKVTPPAPETHTAPDVILPPAAPENIDEARWIDVDLSEQRLTAYENGTPVQTYLVSTGLPQTPTPVGQFRIWIKLRTDDMAGADYYIEDVPWVLYFYGGYGLHGVTWHANFGYQMSHGCINQPNDMAEWLFNFAGVGTLVNVHE